MEDEFLLVEQKDEEFTQEQKELVFSRVEELKCSNAAVLAENDLFERFIGRIDPQHLVSQVEGDGLGAAGASQLEGERHERRQGSRPNTSDRLHQLTLEQKHHVALREVKETQLERDKLRQRYKKSQDNYKASLEEAELRLAEIKRAKKEFECRLLKPLKDNRLEMKEPEKVLQCIEDKKLVSQMERLNLRIHALKVQEKNLLQQRQQNMRKEKIYHEAKNEIDLFQEYNEQRMHSDLGELQDISFKGECVLRSHKEKLLSLTRESTELSNDISNRKQMLAKIEEEVQQAEEECLKAKALNQHLRRQMTDYQAPDITEYIFVKDKRKKLQQSVRTLERKVQIDRMSVRTPTKARSTQRATLPPAYSAEAGAQSLGHQRPVHLPHIAEHST